MLRAVLLSFALLLAFSAAPSAKVRHIDEWSSAKHTTHHARRHARRYAPAEQSGYQQGQDVCRGDAVRLCRPVLSQGNMAVLGCFRSQARRLSRGCRALLTSYGQL